MAWVLARMMVIFFPVALYLVDQPNKGYSSDYILRLVGNDNPLNAGALADVASKDGTVMSFNDLNDAAYNDAKRAAFQGQTAMLEGRFRRLSEKEFTLFRLRMTCCAPDSIPLKVRIVTPYPLSGFSDFDWVSVKGQIQFLPVPDTTPTQYIPVIKVADNSDIVKTPAKSEYE